MMMISLSLFLKLSYNTEKIKTNRLLLLTDFFFSDFLKTRACPLGITNRIMAKTNS